MADFLEWVAFVRRLVVVHGFDRVLVAISFLTFLVHSVAP
jgi:hypothetical protein